LGGSMDLQDIRDKTVVGDRNAVEQLVGQAVEEGVPAGEIISGYLIPALAEVGDRFERGEIFVPEMLLAARAMQTGVSVLEPFLMGSEVEKVGRMVIGTVKGDLHDIGKNLVRMMFEAAGFDVIDIGIDVSAEAFVGAVKENNPDIVGMSALLTTTLPAVGTTIEALVKAGVRDSVKVLVGGAPVTQAYADRVGADGYAPDAAAAARRGKELLGLS
jgi:5-methyltetrahydrofolate--homocysteine methyltransferase